MLDTTPQSAHEAPLGDQLDVLLDQLDRAGHKISPRDRMLSAALVADLAARGQARTFDELRPFLAPLLARSPGDRERFFQVFDLLSPRTQDETIPPLGSIVLPRPAADDRRRRWLIAFLALVVIGIAAWWVWPRQRPTPPPTPTTSGERTPSPPPPIQTTVAPPVTAIETLNRIATAAERFEGAPTIEELSRELARSSTIGWRAESYAIRLNELSGLPKTWPLALYGKDGRDGRIWAMLALALDRIERPGREPTFAELLTGANAALTATGATPKPVYEVAAWLNGALAAPIEPDKAKLLAGIQERYRTEVAKREGKPLPGERLDELTIQRALAILDDPRLRRVYPDAPWLPRHPPSGVPWWTPWAVMLLPLAFALLWLANSLTWRKAYLRRRPPELPPLHLDIVSEAATRVRFASGLFQRIAQRLSLRTPRETDRLDLQASIAATIAQGGEIPVPVYETVRHAPEYLVLIEQRSAGDQDARRLRELVHRLETLLPLSVFYFRTEPSRLEPERGGRSVSIEQLQAQYPDHRLLVLGAGAEFLDPASLKPHPSVEKLTHWEKRALLTPLPLAEWGREEFALANELRLPIGRATPEGLLALTDLLGLDGSEPDTLLDTRGDGLARPLPEMLRVRPQRFLYNAPPSDMPGERIVRDLRNFLDGPGFDWLCALAVYPAVQWDLTLYLGVTLSERTGGNATSAPLYREDRVAALTQLPWLREGLMPNWLRVALIAQLDPVRASEIRAVLKRLIDAAQLSGDTHRDDAVKLRISQEATKDRLPPGELMQDEVLLDFLARGRIEDFALPNASWLERLLPRGWLDRIGLPELTAGAVAAAYAVAALWLSPNAADGALVTGAWLPLVVLLVGAVIVLAASDLPATYRITRAVALKCGNFCLAYSIFVLLLIAMAFVPGNTSQALLNPSVNITYIGGLAFFVGHTWGPQLGFPQQLSGFPKNALIAFVQGMLLFVLLGVADEWIYTTLVKDYGPPSLFSLEASLSPFIDGSNRATPEVVTAHLLVASGPAAVALLAWIFVRFLPERLPPPKPAPRGSKASRLAGGLRAAFSLVPILPAAWLAAYVAASNIQLEPIPGGATAVAELPGGSLFAVGGADGKVRIYERASPRKPLTTIATGSAAISSLAVRADRDGDPASPIALAVSTSDGRIHLFDARGGSRRPLPDSMKDLVGFGSKVHVTLASEARPVAAYETEDGRPRIASQGGTYAIDDSGSVTAMDLIGSNAVVIGTLDGSIRLIETGSSSLLSTDDRLARRPLGRARLFVRTEHSGDARAAISDDGTVIDFSLSDSKLTAGAVTRNSKLSLGAVVGWRTPLSAGGQPVALVIGNAQYQITSRLRNAANDARAVGVALAELGFDIRVELDATDEIMTRALADLRERARGASAAVIFFAGHASSTAGNSFLHPIDDGQPAARSPGFAVDEIVRDVLSPAAGLKLAIIDSHGPGSQATNAITPPGQHCVSRCFAPDRLPPRTAVLFAAGPGSAALDGDGSNSPFTTSLLRRLREPNLSATALSTSITSDVLAVSNGRQLPLLYTNLGSQAITPLGRATPVAEETKPGEAFSPGFTFRDCQKCPEMIVVPAGSFTMGSPATEDGRSSADGPVQRVNFARPFAVGRFAVTFDDWDACVAEGECNGYRPNDEGWGRGLQPAINISWNDAQAYLAWLSRVTGQRYRLLTEPEREYVTRAGTTTAFWWGATINQTYANYDTRRTYGKDGVAGEPVQRTMRVDSFEQNPWGLFNVHGNVWEWTEGCWRQRGDGACTSRVVRGGSWTSSPQELTAAGRMGFAPSVRNRTIGFRIARDLN